MDFMPVTFPAFGGSVDMLAPINAATAAARAADVAVVHVRVAFRPGHPDVAPSNKVFSAVVGSLDFAETSAATGVHPGIEVANSDLHVLKRRVGAFSGSDLELVLRSQGVNHLVLAGITTSGVVLSTLRQAADLDYHITVLSDVCADGDAQIHELMLERVFPAHAAVLASKEWIATLAV
jgi:nicotinamidase-related amidase